MGKKWMKEEGVVRKGKKKQCIMSNKEVIVREEV